MLSKIIKGFLLFFGVASSVYAVDLRDATSQQILDELAFRLRSGGGGGGGGGGSRAMYSCEGTNYLHISVVGPTGAEQRASVYVGSTLNCTSQASTLNSNRGRVNSTTIAAICDSSAYLKRFSITTDGTLSELEARYIGSMQSCMSQAEAINSGNFTLGEKEPVVSLK
jgi:hypothetical protein